MSDREVNIGALLKAARESKDISVASAAMQTNLNAATINKLEENQFQEVGAPVFTRGYLTQYARFLDLDVQKITAAFNRLDHAPTEIRLSSANVASQSRSYRRHSIGTWLVVLPLLLLAGFIITQVLNNDSWLMTQFKEAFNEERAVANGLREGESEILLQVGDDTYATTLPVVGSTEPTDNIASLPDETAAQLPTLTSLEDDVLLEEGETGTGEAHDTGSEAPPAAGSSDLIAIAISSENWVEVRDSDKRIIVSQIYQGGNVIELPTAQGPYEVNIGRPESASLTINGNPADLAQFRIGTTRKFRIQSSQ